MANVVAITKGYYGGVVRDPGARFPIPDDLWADKKRRPSWVKLDPSTAFGGKGDHDGDGSVGGSKPKAETVEAAKPAGKGKKSKADTVEAPTAQPFADAPVPQTVAEAQKAVGGMQPDWVPPDAGAAKPVAD